MEISASIGTKVILQANLTEVETVIWGIAATIIGLITGSAILF